MQTGRQAYSRSGICLIVPDFEELATCFVSVSIKLTLRHNAAGHISPREGIETRWMLWRNERSERVHRKGGDKLGGAPRRLASALGRAGSVGPRQKWVSRRCKVRRSEFRCHKPGRVRYTLPRGGQRQSQVTCASQPSHTPSRVSE